MSIESDVQKLEPGSVITLFELNATAIGGGVLRFHSHLQEGVIWWQGVEYDAWPVKAEGFALTADKPPQPKLTVANTDRVATTLNAFYEDLIGATVVRRRTLAKYLDAANFGGVNPTADPAEHFPDEVWFVERKAMETREAVEYELSSAMDFNGMRLPRRQMVANACGWQYRSAECSYAGGPVAKADGTATSDPALDRCGKRLSDCKLRFGAHAVLPYGSFPACGMTRT